MSNEEPMLAPQGTFTESWMTRTRAAATQVWLANCYFARDSSRFPALLSFYDVQSSRSSHHLYI